MIELISVIAVLGILAAILIPTISRTREKAKTAQCQSNLRQIGAALKLYIADNNFRFPPNRHNLKYHNPESPDGTWEQDALKPYVDGTNFDLAGGGESVTYREAGPFWCPADELRENRNAALSYGSNYYLGVGGDLGPTESALNELNPSSTAYMIDMVRNTGSRTGTAYFSILDYPFGSNTNSESKWAVDFRHGGKANVLFLDGHVSTYSLEEMQGKNPNDL